VRNIVAVLSKDIVDVVENTAQAIADTGILDILESEGVGKISLISVSELLEDILQRFSAHEQSEIWSELEARKGEVVELFSQRVEKLINRDLPRVSVGTLNKVWVSVSGNTIRIEEVF